MSHRFLPGPLGRCAICTRTERAHADLPVRLGTRLGHNDLVRLLGRCDGRCGTHTGVPFAHNDLVRLYGRCDGSCSTPH
jgi:hypothetical protein